MLRSTIYLLGAACLLVVLYGTLVPFDLDWKRGIDWQPRWSRLQPGDAVANILLYVPIGVFLRLAYRRRGTGMLWESMAALTTITLVSYFTEALQGLSPSRVPTLTDSACNVAGASLGILFAPLFQRVLRNLHAWGFETARHRPFTASAAAVTVCIFVYGLAPFDPKPTLGHIEQALTDLMSAESILPFGGGFGGDAELSPPEAIDKVMDATSYGLLAFVLVLSMREAGRSVRSACWYSLTRSMAMVVSVEAVQLFTMSHRTDPADLTAGWICILMASGATWIILTRHPFLHRRPLAVFRVVVTLATLMIIAGTAMILVLEEPATRVVAESWWPMVNNFPRTWNAVLGSYARTFLQCGVVAGLFVAWARSLNRRPWSALVLTGCMAMVSLAVAIYAGRSIDTANLVMALAAGVGAVRLDRAFFEPIQAPARRQPA